MPQADLLRNPNCIIIKTESGGHCDFFTKREGKKFYSYERVIFTII